MTAVALPAQASVRRPSWRWSIVVFAAVAALVAGLWFASEGEHTGPLNGGGGGWSSAPVRPGQWLDTAVFALPLQGSEPATLVSVTPIGTDPATGLRLRYAVITEARHGYPGAIRGWPPKHTELAPVRGFVVRPGERLAVVVGATSGQRGTWGVPAFRITYRVRGVEYSSTLHQGLVVKVRPGWHA